MCEFERRIEQHMARGNELMADVRQEMRLNRVSYERQANVLSNALERNREAFERNSAVMANLIERHERVTDGMIEALRDMRDEIRAETRAIFKVIDRLEGGASAA